MTPPRPGHFALRFLAVSAVALATANCANTSTTKLAGSGNGLDPKYGVKASPRLYNEGDVIPKGGGRRYTGKPYVVAGETYTPRENPRGYVREGLASWYGAAFHGRMTANGEVFDRHSIAAAHPTLPLPSYVRVTNLENHSSMIVRVNDRGPYHAGRVMDVSEETAEALGFHRRGTARVRVEYVGKASLAGSDDRKLLATLRTDGQPASGRSPVMMADLGPSEEPERFERSAPPLAFKPAPEREDAPAEARKPVRAPILLASAAVAVPAAVQPTALRTKDFKPLPVAAAGTKIVAKGEPVRVAGLNPGIGRPALAASPGHATLAKAPAGRQEGPPLRLASAARAEEAAPRKAAGKSIPAAMPPSAKLAMARLTTQAAPGRNAEKPGTGTPGAKGLAEKATTEKKTLVASKAAGGKPAEPARGAKPGARYAGIY